MTTSVEASAECGNFFLVVAPGLEEAAERELLTKWPHLCGLVGAEPEALALSPRRVEGGLELQGIPLNLGYFLNVVLKIPTRILLRLSSFRCRDFPKLFQKVRRLPWRRFLRGQTPSVHVSAERSRLMHKARLTETVSAGLAAYYKDQAPKRDAKLDELPPFGVYVRLVEDNCLVSVDTSGLALYKRWPGKKVGRAPLRETIAAALFASLASQWSDKTRRILLIDPFCGSGTLLAEASSYYHTHAARDYAFLHFPSFRGTEQFRAALASLHRIMPPPHELTAWGFDRDEQVLSYARTNYPGLSISFHRGELESLNPDLARGSEDARSFEAVAILANPPYGKRLKLAGRTGEVYAAFLKRIHELWAPELCGLVLPKNSSTYLAESGPLQQSGQLLSFQNGGVRVTLQLFRRSDKRP